MQLDTRRYSLLLLLLPTHTDSLIANYLHSKNVLCVGSTNLRDDYSDSNNEDLEVRVRPYVMSKLCVWDMLYVRVTGLSVYSMLFIRYNYWLS